MRVRHTALHCATYPFFTVTTMLVFFPTLYLHPTPAPMLLPPTGIPAYGAAGQQRGRVGSCRHLLALWKEHLNHQPTTVAPSGDTPQGDVHTA